MSDPKRRCVQTSRDPEVWMQWFNEISSGEESPLDEEDSDEKEEDVCVESDHHETESEQEIPEVDQDEPDWEEETDEGEADTFYWRKDKVTKWKKGRSNTQVRTRSQNIIKLLPGTKGSARNARSETDCLKLFINDTVIRIITISTNIYHESQKANCMGNDECPLTLDDAGGVLGHAYFPDSSGTCREIHL
ncbi:unnamed protein product [Acanthoscelides obtectus]|uniref:Uncharacterized protein n=1 Tax=Acanthoscelides obtectus TaxID=200917 RepID=A0A9P0Q7C4_ACAOB|nr:unnamed protein product [Acanthoscelides obtectus]CAK1680483.1 hypothetical protein AOBTE_LOCUS32692 [Acanthoscelides obtectus]